MPVVLVAVGKPAHNAQRTGSRRETAIQPARHAGQDSGSLPCTVAHTWQTFAIAVLPADVQTFDVNIVQANPAVRAVCSLRVLLRARLPLARRFRAHGAFEAPGAPGARGPPVTAAAPGECAGQL